MNVSDNILFAKGSLYDQLRHFLSQVKEHVNAISKEQFLANSDDQVINHLYSKLEIVPLIIYRDQSTISEPEETRFQRTSRRTNETIYVEGVLLVLTLPYSGETSLWLYQPSTITFDPPCGNVIPDRRNNQIGVLEIKLVYSHTEFQDAIVNKETEQVISSIEAYLTYIKRDIEKHNNQLRSEISREVQRRREQLGAIHKTVQKLNIPINRREGAPDTTQLPIKRRVLEPLPTKGRSEPEYEISNVDYEDILDFIRHEGASFERTPLTFTVHDEEGLRNIILAQLNTTFQGQASGETFRKRGKTDICIEFENRAAFVAECKIWNGGQKLHEAINQLLDYLTWRDVKTALVIFNKDVIGFTQIQGKMIEILRTHPNCLRAEILPSQNEWNMILRSKDDPDRLITVQVFLFNLYSAE